MIVHNTGIDKVFPMSESFHDDVYEFISCLNVLPHVLHLYGLSSVCSSLLCRIKALEVLSCSPLELFLLLLYYYFYYVIINMKIAT